MRTTVNLDEDVLHAARAIARSEQRGLGAVVSDLARRGLAPSPEVIADEDGFPVFRVQAGSRPITDAMVDRALEES